MKFSWYVKLLLFIVGGVSALLTSFTALITYAAFTNCLKTEHDAQQGNTESQIHLGYGYESGRLETYSLGRIPQDEIKAIYWYTRAYQSGNRDGGHALADLYSRKHTSSANLLALNWYEKVALKGDQDAAKQLFHIYQYGGLGQPKDTVKALQWKKFLQKQNPSVTGGAPVQANGEAK